MASFENNFLNFTFLSSEIGPTSHDTCGTASMNLIRAAELHTARFVNQLVLAFRLGVRYLALKLETLMSFPPLYEDLK